MNGAFDGHILSSARVCTGGNRTCAPTDAALLPRTLPCAREGTCRVWASAPGRWRLGGGGGDGRNAPDRDNRDQSGERSALPSAVADEVIGFVLP